MTSGPNPYAPPSPIRVDPSRFIASPGDLPNEPPVDECALTSAADGKGATPPPPWTARFYPTSVFIHPPDARSILMFSRADFLAYSELHLGGLMRLLVVRQPTTLSFMLDVPAIATLRSWLSPVLTEHLALHLKRRLRFSIPMGLFLVLAALLTIQGQRVNYGGFIFGAGFLLAGLVSTVRTHRAIVMCEALLWLLMATSNIARFAQIGGAWQLGFAAAALVFVRGAFRTYRFYGPVRPLASLEG